MEQIIGKQRRFTVKECYDALSKCFRTLPSLITARKNHTLSEAFIKRIMLSVTEVNGCEICAYSHTDSALKMGMSEREIQALLAGAMDDIPPTELKAILFAQHYAERKGRPSIDAWQEIITSYGTKKAYAILGAIRMIMVGNSYGLAFSALQRRIKGKEVVSSTLGQELVVACSLLPALPIAGIHALLMNISKKAIV